MRLRSLIIYGSAASIAALSLWYSLNRENAPQAPSADGLSITSEPADKFDAASRDICKKSIDTLLMCQKLQKQYPALSSAIINATVHFSKFYGHTNPSALLTLQLVESKGDVIEGFSEQSTAFGPFHYLVDSFCDKLVTDVKVVGKKVRKENALLIHNVKRHFRDPSTVGDMANRCSDYMAVTREDLATLKKMQKEPPKGLTKEQLAAAIAEIKTRVKTRRVAMRDIMLKEFPNEVIAIQYVDKLMNTDPQKLYNGTAYAEHILWIVGAEQLQGMITRERIARDEFVKAVAAKKPVKPQQTIKQVHINTMLTLINAANGSNYKEFVIPPYSGEIYPAFTKEFSSRAPGNFGLFFKTQKIREEKTLPATVKGGTPTKVIKVRTLVTPRTAAEVQKEILDRWEAHHKNARPLDAFAKEFANTHTVPTAPAFVRTAQNAAPVIAQN